MEDIFSYWPWLLLLLPVAYLLGWLKGISFKKAESSNSSNSLSSDYFKGLNYLLSDQQERALPVFLHLVQVDNETIDTHLALATIYRRSGNYDKAIEVHQNLIAKPSLSAKYRSKALLELGRDYLAAGLFDRAEGLFNDVIKNGFYEQQARQYMLDIYQQEKEWSEAVKVTRSLIQNGDSTLRSLIAQFYCEISDQYFKKGNIKQAEVAAKDALSYDSDCIRAIIVRVQNAVALRKFKDAIKFIKRIEQTDSRYFPVILPYCIESYRELGKLNELIDYLKSVESHHANLSLMQGIVNLLVEVKGEEAALIYIQKQLVLRPNINGLASFIELMNKQDNFAENSHFQKLQKAVEHIRQKNDLYQCNKCGYTSGTLNWQCPSCLVWGEIKPLIGDMNAKN
ncbi:MAG: lipopolysaccharide assembly protein LapB [Gammaproteobacteria bacterium]|nr:lipopolysaccharide assembly protein LapB [Gammaproteobacteria bacterium]